MPSWITKNDQKTKQSQQQLLQIWFLWSERHGGGQAETEGCHTRCVQCTHCAYCFRFGFNIGHVTPTVFLAPKRVIYILNSRQNSKKAIEMRIAHTCNGNHISLPILLALVIEVHFHKHQCWKQSASRNASGTRARRNTSPVLQCFDINVLWYNSYEQCSLIDSF